MMFIPCLALLLLVIGTNGDANHVPLRLIEGFEGWVSVIVINIAHLTQISRTDLPMSPTEYFFFIFKILFNNDTHVR